MDSLRRLEEIFGHFPGIGPRQARRFVYYLQNKSPSFIKEFVQLVESVKKDTAECDLCHRFFMHSGGGKMHSSHAETHSHSNGMHLCHICSDSARDKSTLMIVARDSDFETVEKSGAYRGLYFILGGTVPVLDNEPEKRIRLRSLLERVSDDHAVWKEIILSLNTTPDGEHTADIVRDAIDRIFGDTSVDTTNVDSVNSPKISILGRGLSTGAELEYVDGETIKNALKNRG